MYANMNTSMYKWGMNEVRGSISALPRANNSQEIATRFSTLLTCLGLVNPTENEVFHKFGAGIWVCVYLRLQLEIRICFFYLTFGS